MPGTGPRAKYWHFVFKKQHTPEDLNNLFAHHDVEDMQFITFKPMLQGTVHFRSRKRLSQVLTIVRNADCWPSKPKPKRTPTALPPHPMANHVPGIPVAMVYSLPTPVLMLSLVQKLMAYK